jgi:signal transduction histidine kinase
LQPLGWLGLLATLFDFDGNLQPEFNQLQSVLKQKGEWQGKVRLNKKDGTRIWMLLNITVIYDNERHIKSYVCIQLDFNDLHELELRLYDSNMKEKHLNQIKSKFINVTSHEIRTPLANIELSTELIRMSLHNEERVLKNLTKISHQVKNITNIMDDFLILSKIELGSVEINQKPVDLTACIKEVINEKIAINDEKRIMITENNRLPKAPECKCKVPAVSGTGALYASHPAMANGPMMGKKRAKSITTPVLMFQKGVLSPNPSKPEPLLAEAEVNSYNISLKP